MKLNGTLSQNEWKTLIFATDIKGKTAFDSASSYQKTNNVMELLNQIIREFS